MKFRGKKVFTTAHTPVCTDLDPQRDACLTPDCVVFNPLHLHSQTEQCQSVRKWQRSWVLPLQRSMHSPVVRSSAPRKTFWKVAIVFLLLHKIFQTFWIKKKITQRYTLAIFMVIFETFLDDFSLIWGYLLETSWLLYEIFINDFWFINYLRLFLIYFWPYLGKLDYFQSFLG